MAVQEGDKRSPSATTAEHYPNFFIIIDPPNFALHTTFNNRAKMLGIIFIYTLSRMFFVPKASARCLPFPAIIASEPKGCFRPRM